MPYSTRDPKGSIILTATHMYLGPKPLLVAGKCRRRLDVRLRCDPHLASTRRCYLDRRGPGFEIQGLGLQLLGFRVYWV